MYLEGCSKDSCFPSNGNYETQSEYGDSAKKYNSNHDHYFSKGNDRHEIDIDEYVNPQDIDTPYLDEAETTKMILQKVKKIEYSYRNVAESFSVTMNRWLDLRKKILTTLHGAEMKFRLIHRTTSSITFISSTIEMVARAGLLLHDLFDYDSIFPFKIIPVLSGISLTSSLMALFYSKSTLDDVSRDIRDEKRLHIDMETIYRKGNHIDDSVQNLFPYGIDLNLMKDEMCKLDVKNTDARTWRRLLCSVIISTNLRENETIKKDKNFLKSLKAFVRSNAAQLWISRIKMRKLLDEMDLSKSIGRKELSSGSEAFLGMSAVNLYPAFFPLFFNNESFEKARLVSSTITTILTAKKVAGKEKDEFGDLRQTWQALKEEYKKIKKMNKYALEDYE